MAPCVGASPPPAVKRVAACTATRLGRLILGRLARFSASAFLAAASAAQRLRAAEKSRSVERAPSWSETLRCAPLSRPRKRALTASSASSSSCSVCTRAISAEASRRNASSRNRACRPSTPTLHGRGRAEWAASYADASSASASRIEASISIGGGVLPSFVPKEEENELDKGSGGGVSLRAGGTLSTSRAVVSPRVVSARTTPEIERRSLPVRTSSEARRGGSVRTRWAARRSCQLRDSSGDAYSGKSVGGAESSKTGGVLATATRPAVSMGAGAGGMVEVGDMPRADELRVDEPIASVTSSLAALSPPGLLVRLPSGAKSLLSPPPSAPLSAPSSSAPPRTPTSMRTLAAAAVGRAARMRSNASVCQLAMSARPRSPSALPSRISASLSQPNVSFTHAYIASSAPFGSFSRAST